MASSAARARPAAAARRAGARAAPRVRPCAARVRGARRLAARAKDGAGDGDRGEGEGLGGRLMGWLRGGGGNGREGARDTGDNAAVSAPAEARQSPAAPAAVKTAKAASAPATAAPPAASRAELEARFKSATLEETRAGEGERKKQLSLLDQLVPPPEPKKAPVYDFSKPNKVEEGAEAGAAAGADAAGASGAGAAAGSGGDASGGSDGDSATNEPIKADESDVLRGELMDLLSKQLPAEDVERIKKKVFSMDTYYVTGTSAASRFGPDVEATAFKGNVRSKDPAELFKGCKAALQKEFGDKYVLYMVEQQPDLMSEGASIEEMMMAAEDEEARIGFVVANREQVTLTTPWWRSLSSLVLFSFTALTSLQLGAATSVSKFPELVKQLSGPDAATSIIPEETLVALLDTSLPIAQGVLLVTLAHETGHRLAAAVYDIELTLPLFIPNTQLGTFGAITECKSVLPSKKAQFDIAAAGPAASFLAGGALFGYGLLTTMGSDPAELVPVPSQVFQSSLLMGLSARGAMGYQAMHQAQVMVSPELIAGWCALTSAALNVLPVGRIDGGVMAASALGQGTKSFLGFVTYLGLGFGVFARPNVSLLWAIYVLALQRQQMALCEDEITEAGDARATAAVTALSVALLLLLPIGPELANELGIGIGNDILPWDVI